MLTTEMTKGIIKQFNYFKEDKKVSTGSTQLADYKDSGYDRGQDMTEDIYIMQAIWH